MKEGQLGEIQSTEKDLSRGNFQPDIQPDNWVEGRVFDVVKCSKISGHPVCECFFTTRDNSLILHCDLTNPLCERVIFKEAQDNSSGH